MSDQTRGPADEQGDASAPPPENVHDRGLPFELRFLSELRRRNVGRIAVLYLFAAWVVLQPVNVVFDMLDVPSWANRLVVLVLALGFPAALLFAWIYELTPDGLKQASRIEPQQSITEQTGRRLDRAIIAVLAIALAYFVADKFWLSKPAAIAPATTQTAGETPADTAAIAVPPEKSIAVMPFLDLSEKRDQEYFSDGISEQLIDLISRIPDVRVAARTSSFYYKGRQATIPEIAKTLGVAHVLEGSVRKAGDALRVTVQLVRADNGYHLWSETYDRKLDDVFQVQDDIAAAVVDALKVSLLGEAPHAAHAASTEAYTLFLQGRAFALRSTGADNMKAAEYLHQALEQDPNYAPAWSALAAVHIRSFGLYSTDTDYEKNRGEATDAVERALALDPQLADAHVQKSAILWLYEHDMEGAERELKLALELESGNINALAGASLLAASIGHFDEAREYGQESVARDPLAVESYRVLYTASYLGGDYGDAEAALRKVLELYPTVEAMYYRLGIVLLARDEPAEALEAMEREPDPHRRQIGRTLALDALGRTAEADEARALVEQNAEGWAYQVADIYAHRGDVEQAFAWLDRAYELHDFGLVLYLKGDPLLKSLRADPRYAALLRKLNLPL